MNSMNREIYKTFNNVINKYVPIRKCERENNKLVLYKRIGIVNQDYKYNLKLYTDSDLIYEVGDDLYLFAIIGYHHYKWKYKFKKLDLLVDEL